jgi:hypothetical protein
MKPGAASRTICGGGNKLNKVETPNRCNVKPAPPPYVWPRLLELPPGTLNVVYLDLNHWIGLAQASVGHVKGSSFAETLEACRAARSAGTALFVLSGTIYAEMLKIKDPAQRQTLAEVMEELTDFATLVSRVVVMECEISAMLDPFAKVPSLLSQVPLIGRGVRHAFGLSSGITIMGPTGDETVREVISAHRVEDIIAEAFMRFERSVLRGPSDNQEAEELRALGWNREAVNQIAENRAAQERYLTNKLDAEHPWRSGRLRDVVSMRELLIEFQDILPRALNERGLVLADVITDEESSRAFVRAMPSTEVSIELKRAWHRNGQKQWIANNIYDVDAMALAIPYCDVVVTEKACHHILSVAGLGERMHTALLQNLDDLPRTLAEWKSKRAAQ